MRIKALGLFIGVAVCATPVFAAGNKAPINRIEHRQQLRINRGIKSGELTRAEARRLEAEQARIRIDERFARFGGLTAKERERLQRELHRSSNDIYHQKHDRQDRN